MTRAAFPLTAEGAALFPRVPALHGIREAALHGMGRGWMDAPLRPRCAVLTAGDFLLCGGVPGPSARHLLRCALLSERREWLISAPERWAEALSAVARVTIETRCAFDPAVQPKDAHLRAIMRHLPEGAALLPLEGPRVSLCRKEAWSRDFVSQYTDEDYAKRGLGMLLTVDGQAVAGASSYLSYPGGIEVQVQTREGFEGRGYATLASAGLILRAHERGLRATWDAANPTSAHLAEKLGYRPAGSYTICVFQDFQP